MFSAHWSSDAAAMTDFREQPETPGPQPRHGSNASAVPSTVNREFSSKLGCRPEVSARVVELGMLSLAAEDAESEAELLLFGVVEPPQPASRPTSIAAQSAREMIRIRFITNPPSMGFRPEQPG